MALLLHCGSIVCTVALGHYTGACCQELSLQVMLLAYPEIQATQSKINSGYNFTQDLFQEQHASVLLSKTFPALPKKAPSQDSALKTAKRWPSHYLSLSDELVSSR
jgi:hypothetical protein